MSDENKLMVPTGKDPLAGVPVTGDPEVDSKAEVDAMLEAFGVKPTGKDGYFRNKEQAENNRRKLAMQSEFYFCVVFKSREQKEAFLAAAGLTGYGDRYLDGEKVAAKLGVAIPAVEIKFQGEKHDKAMTLNFDPIQKGGE